MQNHTMATLAPDLGAICRRIMFVDDATAVLAQHATYVWNKSRTRIRCSGCPEIIDVPGGPDSGDAVAAFARHQAEQLPEPEPAQNPEPAAADPEAEPQPTEAEPAAASEPIEDQEQDLEPEGDQDTEEPAGDTVEQALSEAALAVADQAIAPKIRRDTKTLTATIAEIKKGDRVSASFNHPRYGYFTVEGTVIKGGTGLDRKQLMVGGWYINLNERAAKYLCGLEILAAAGQHDFVIPKPSEQTEHVGIGN